MSKIIIYLAHAKEYPDFKQNLYLPLVDLLTKDLHLILPHQNSDSPFNSRQLIFYQKVDLVLAELSYPATGLGIEMGWANSQNIPIIGLTKNNYKVSSSAQMLCQKILFYDELDSKFREELLEELSKLTPKLTAKNKI
jgi:nucleoside 2-deoxyribosyltransferase